MVHLRFFRSVIFVVTLLTQCLGVTRALADGFATDAETRPTTVNSLRFPYNSSSDLGINPETLREFWIRWRDQYVVKVPVLNSNQLPKSRVAWEFGRETTVSEGMAAGMFFAAIFDEQKLFDSLFRFVRQFKNQNGFMHWFVHENGDILNPGGATDADLDIAMSLVFACSKRRMKVWDADPGDIDYCNEARVLIKQISRYEVLTTGPIDPNTGRSLSFLLPGDQWDINYFPAGVFSPSYISPAYYVVFGKFTEEEAIWRSIFHTSLLLYENMQNQPANCSALFPNWADFHGQPLHTSWLGADTKLWGWEAPRSAWRLALGNLWYRNARLERVVNRMAGFFGSVGMNSIVGFYDGSGISKQADTHWPFFYSAGAGVFLSSSAPEPRSCGAADGTLRSTRRDALTQLLRSLEPTYYTGQWHLRHLLAVSGNIPNLFELSQRGESVTPTPTMTSTVRPLHTPTMTAAPTPLPTFTLIPTAPPPTPTLACALTEDICMNLGAGQEKDPNSCRCRCKFEPGGSDWAQCGGKGGWYSIDPYNPNGCYCHPALTPSPEPTPPGCTLTELDCITRGAGQELDPGSCSCRCKFSPGGSDYSQCGGRGGRIVSDSWGCYCDLSAIGAGFALEPTPGTPVVTQPPSPTITPRPKATGKSKQPGPKKQKKAKKVVKKKK
jgi:endo-1,4-beta-D-glucanase Y